MTDPTGPAGKGSLEARIAEGAGVGYLVRPIPTTLDHEIQSALTTPAASERWALLQPRFGPEQAPTLRAFAERAAARAVREGASHHLDAALMALALAGLEQGSREALLILPLIHDSAVRLGAPPEDLFERVATQVGAQAAESLRGFRERTNKSIAQMGYVAEGAGPTFRYRRTW